MLKKEAKLLSIEKLKMNDDDNDDVEVDGDADKKEEIWMAMNFFSRCLMVPLLGLPGKQCKRWEWK